VNKEIDGLVNRHGGKAVGLSGKDGNLIRAEKYYLSEDKAKDTPPEIIDIGLVGKVTNINAALIASIEREGFIPVIAPTGVGNKGETYNINADIVAGEVAAALKAEKLILLTDVEGVLDENNQLINTMNNREIMDMIQAGTIKGGMFPKVKCCMKALKGDVKKAHIIDGRLKHAVLLEIFTDKGIGTEIVL
jgi:acetylglutamate kinase